MYAGYEKMLDEMRARKEYLIFKKQALKKRLFLIVGLSVTVIISLLMYLYLFKVKISPEIIYLSIALYIIMPLLSYPFLRTRDRFYDEAIQDLDFEIDLMQFKVSRRESRAEKLLRINRAQLQRYYSLNLNQNIWVFIVGIICILIGIAAVGITFLLLLSENTPKDAKIIIAVVGSIGSILANFVAAIYLNMHAKASQNLTDFHTKLVDTQKILLGNLLASRIEDETKRWDTLSLLSIELMKKG